MSGIFISHTHSDRLLADAVAQLVEDLFGNRVVVRYSTQKEIDRGITPGADWYRWIVDQVETAQVAFILITPSSIQKPWVIWEAGAVAGAAFASKKEGDPVIPLIYGVRTTELPDFFARFQTVTATDEADVIKLTDLLQQLFGDASGVSASAMRKFVEAQEKAIARYLVTVTQVLKDLPHLITEAAIQEWLERLSDLQRGGRHSEAGVLESWMNVAFGREEKGRQQPLDIRIHRRLGELYATAADTAGAVRQFELAQRLVPRDIFILRRLGKAYLDQGNVGAADEVLDRIALLDPSAFERNIENAALKARAHRTKKDFAGARDVLERAFNYNSSSYYLGDLLGQMHLALGDVTRAKDVYSRVRLILDDLAEQNVWTTATALTSSIVLDDEAAVEREIGILRRTKPTLEQLRSIERGLDEVLKALGRDDRVRRRIREMEPDGDGPKS